MCSKKILVTGGAAGYVGSHTCLVLLDAGYDVIAVDNPVNSPGDIAECYADSPKAKEEMGWLAKRGICEMCADSWRRQSRNPDGY